MLRYVVPDTPGKQHSLLAGLDVNPLEGWDPAKVNHSDADGNHHLVSFIVQKDGTLADKKILFEVKHTHSIPQM